VSRDPTVFLRSVKALPSLPEIYFQLEEAIQHPQISFEEIAELISRDTGLSARLLRIANSSLFAFPGRIETVTRAVTMVGMQQLRDLVLATEIVNLFIGFGSDTVSMESFLKHSIGCGTVARVLATLRHEPNVEWFYVTGLLHDIGRLVLYVEVPDQMEQITEEAAADSSLLYRVEQQVFGFDHALLGGLLLAHWHLPESQQAAVAHHHNPLATQRFPVEAAIIHLADIIALAVWPDNSGELFVPPLNPAIWERLGYSTAQLDTIVDRSTALYAETMELFFQ
jgi:HD-like signal output (HDOD) protein